MDSRTPVLVGAGQIKQRIDDPAGAAEPLSLMIQAAERAAADAAAPSLLAALDSIRVPRGLWPYANPAALLREHFGCPRAQTVTAPISGSTVQRLVSHAALEIAQGRREAVLIVGAEAERSKRRARSTGIELDWTEQLDSTPDENFGEDDGPPGFGRWERRYRAHPPQTFALFENALRAERGEGVAAHRRRISELWAGFSRVAADNPHAWQQEPMSAEEIATPTEVNRLIAFPYTKYLVSNMVVDLGAAVIVCSVDSARRFGVPEEKWVYPHSATDVFSTTPLGVRDTFHDQPALGAAGRRALELAELGPADVHHVDLYSCFPSAVQIAAAELGFDTERPLTVTGGLTFAGGPFNSYVLHSIATLMERLRSDPGSRGLISGIGGYMAKHAFGLYSSEPPAAGFRYEDVSERALSPRVEWDEDYVGPAIVETFTHLHGRDDGEDDFLLAACRIDAGRRTWAVTEDSALLEVMQREELVGRSGRVRAGVVELI